MGVCPFYFLVFTSFKEPDLPYDSDSKKYEIVKELAGDLSWKPLVSLGFEITRSSGSGGS